MFCSFFFNDTATTEIYTLSLHDALPILDMFLGDLFGLVLAEVSFETDEELDNFPKPPFALADVTNDPLFSGGRLRSEEHTSELQSLAYLVCRLLLEKKKKKNAIIKT